MKRILRENTEQMLVGLSVVLCLVLSFSFVSVAASEQVVNGSSTSFSDFTDSQEGIVFDGEGIVGTVLPSIADMPGNIEHVAPLRSLMIDGSEYEMAEENIIREPGNSVMTIDDVIPGSSVGFLLDPADRIVSLWVLGVEIVVEEKKTAGEHETPSMSTPLPNDIQNINGVWVN